MIRENPGSRDPALRPFVLFFFFSFLRGELPDRVGRVQVVETLLYRLPGTREEISPRLFTMRWRYLWCNVRLYDPSGTQRGLR